MLRPKLRSQRILLSSSQLKQTIETKQSTDRRRRVSVRSTTSLTKIVAPLPPKLKTHTTSIAWVAVVFLSLSISISC